jgi:hypothetical protein
MVARFGGAGEVKYKLYRNGEGDLEPIDLLPEFFGDPQEIFSRRSERQFS